ncbi:LysM peptidoglycan-binding domain-containing protein [Streptomyces sp. CA-210063]|uniref:LysM peptidoglycan-binding domain-containing protein n=1 Tax=Streptomyces sp. CA-210063 TaxID=2801029 RepID=UPI00214BF840|nr:LysM peptidoglycan-binding domain-containing protein [Streptomyces sp. CA-210063]UUU33374.1 LysM peptidoglycan-binding domain-containing protein [Streptomyces sp. CA-210063]
MLSGNGRHRRPRQAPALLVAAGVTGSAIAIPLLGATGASAASGTTWDQVAECESGGSWSADTGNGRYGGLQLTQANWEKYGGLDYATSADQASRSQQIAIAEKVLADQGVGVWSVCGVLHNLAGDSGSADVDTGAADGSSNSDSSSGSSDTSGTSDSSRSTDSSESSDSSANVIEGSTKADIDSDDSTGSGSDTSKGSDSSSTDDSENDNSDNSGQSDDSSAAEDTENGTGRHRGTSADESTDADADAAGDSRTGSRADSSSSGRHASRGGDAAREAVDGSYTVRAGDSLTGIANSLGLDGGWRELYAENEGTVGTDPDLILPGQTLEVGVETGEK